MRIVDERSIQSIYICSYSHPFVNCKSTIRQQLIITSAKYVISSPDYQSCPKPDRPEYAFIGRSNVGKSSLINLVTDQKSLAKTSASPGKTKLINHFEIESISGEQKKETPFQWYIVDLPGYGFAKVSQGERKKWEKMIKDYILKRENLVNIFVLIDSRHKPQAIDIEFINRLGEWKVPFSMVFTKSDKETQKVVSNNVNDFLKKMKERWSVLPPHFVTSAEKRLGREKLLGLIEELNRG